MQLARTGWPSEAERFYRKALARGSKVPLAEQVAPGLGDALMDEGRYPESRESLDSALAMGDPTGSCQSSIGQLLLLEGAEPQKALDLADKAIQIAAHDVEVRYRYDRRERGQNLGGSGAWALKAWALAQVGRRAEARQAIDAALKLVDAAQAGVQIITKPHPPSDRISALSCGCGWPRLNGAPAWRCRRSMNAGMPGRILRRPATPIPRASTAFCPSNGSNRGETALEIGRIPIRRLPSRPIFNSDCILPATIQVLNHHILGMAKKTSRNQLTAAAALIERCIYVIRGHKVMVDADLADLYRVPTKRLNEAVKRNLGRFPRDFMFRLCREEAQALASQLAISNLRSQIATSSYGGRRTSPYAFTEHGVLMLSSVLNSPRALQMNILITRSFIKMRELLASDKDLARKIERIEEGQKDQARIQRQHASILVSVVQDIKKLKDPPTTGVIGFITRSPKE